MMMIFLFQHYGVDIPRSHSCRSAVEDLADMRQHWLVSLSLSLSLKSRSWSPEVMASYKTSQSQASLWRTLDMSFSSPLLLLQSLLLLPLFWDTLLGPNDTDTSLELFLFFCESWMCRTEKNHHLQNLSCVFLFWTWAISGTQTWPSHSDINPEPTINMQIWARNPNCWLPCGQIDHCRYCAAPALETKGLLILILANCCCIKVL
jgi:hypothetical protein